MNVNLQKFIEKQMLPQKPLNEGEELSEDGELLEDILNEDDSVSEAAEPKPMSEEELKIESLKIATNIAKLMSDVTTDDIITIADKVAGFIRDHSIGSDESSSSSEESSEESSNIADELELPSESEENKEGEE